MTIAQGEQSCIVFGMPKAAIERGHAMRVIELEAMASTFQVQCLSGRTAAAARP
jgi:chemotaxis response regulator CheB